MTTNAFEIARLLTAELKRVDEGGRMRASVIKQAAVDLLDLGKSHNDDLVLLARLSTRTFDYIGGDVASDHGMEADQQMHKLSLLAFDQLAGQPCARTIALAADPDNRDGRSQVKKVKP